MSATVRSASLMTQEEFDAAIAGGDVVTYHESHCPAVTSLGTFPCDWKACKAEDEHRHKLALEGRDRL